MLRFVKRLFRPHLQVDVRYFHKGVPRIKPLVNGDWIDLALPDSVSLFAGDFRLLPLGVAMRLPKGYEALVAPRSSTFVKYGLMQANSLGVIDNSYSGSNDQWHFPAYATRDVVIPAGTRICQFRLVRNQPQVRLVEVDRLDDTDRGGFGSTGA